MWSPQLSREGNQDGWGLFQAGVLSPQLGGMVLLEESHVCCMNTECQRLPFSHSCKNNLLSACYMKGIIPRLPDLESRSEAMVT